VPVALAPRCVPLWSDLLLVHPDPSAVVAAAAAAAEAHDV